MIKRILSITAVVLFAALAIVAAQDTPKTKTATKRAAPPKFDPAMTRQIFFDDVFTKLDGQRPAASTAAAAPPGVGSVPGSTATPGTPAAASASGGWAKVISPTTIEDEIKAIKLEVAKNVTTPSDFAGRGHKVIRREFSILAMLFAVINEYEGEVRFKKDAPAARNSFARAANNTKAGGNVTVFQEAKLRKGELDELLNGSSLPAASNDETPDWPTIVDRVPLMQRLEMAFQTKVSPAMGSKDEFEKNKDMVTHEAEMIATIATVLTKTGMSDADDETYKGFATTMQQAGSEIVDAVKLNSYDQARAAAGKITKACDQCHEAYR
jgi:hypothetical protein